MKKNDKIFIAGHTGLIGQALVAQAHEEGYNNLLLVSRDEIDLREYQGVERLFRNSKPDYVIIAAGKTGGISANKRYPAELFYENLVIQTNLIHSSYLTSVKKLLYIGCSCLYPGQSPQPMKEEHLFTGKFEPSNEAYSVAKLSGLVMCQAYNQQYRTMFISCIAGNLFGPHDMFDIENSHVIPALFLKFHNAKIKNLPSVSLWGTGIAKREFIYSMDFARACLFLLDRYDDPRPINIGSQEVVTIRELASLIQNVVGYKGQVQFDATESDGMLEKTLDSSRISELGWKAEYSLQRGLEQTYQWFLASK